MKSVYTFRILEDVSRCDGSDKAFGFEMDMVNVAEVWGKLIALFGQTKYVSDEMEEAFSYILEAVDSENESLPFSIYYGATGLAIGMHKEYQALDKAKEVVAEFMDKLGKTVPVDFDYEGYYPEYGCKVELGVANGKGYARDFELDEDGQYVEIKKETERQLPEIMELRMLSIDEKRKFKHFISRENTEAYQYFLGMIATDLIPEEEVTIEKLLELFGNKKFHGSPYHADPVLCIFGMIETWICKCTEYKKHGLVDVLDREQIRGLKNSMEACIYGFTNCICDVGVGTIGKKQNDLEREFCKLKEWLYIKKKKDIYRQPEIIYRFAVTYMEKLGFHFIMRTITEREIDLDIFKVWEL